MDGFETSLDYRPSNLSQLLLLFYLILISTLLLILISPTNLFASTRIQFSLPNMHASFFALLAITTAALVSGAPLGNRDDSSPTLGKGGDAVSGDSGSVDGGDNTKSGGLILNVPFASKFSV